MNTPCLVLKPLQAYCTIFHPTVNIVSSHMDHLGHPAGVGSWHTPGDSVPENIVFCGEQQGNTTKTSTTEKNTLFLGLMQENGRTVAVSSRKGSAMSNRIAALLCLMLLFAACAAFQSEYVILWDHSSSPNCITSPGLHICFAISSVTDKLHTLQLPPSHYSPWHGDHRCPELEFMKGSIATRKASLAISGLCNQ